MNTYIKLGSCMVLALLLAFNSFAQETDKKPAGNTKGTNGSFLAHPAEAPLPIGPLPPEMLVRNASPECAADFVYVPDDAAICMTANISRLAGSLGLKDKLDKIPGLNEMLKEVGTSASKLEQFTVASSHFSMFPNGSALDKSKAKDDIYILRTNKPCKQEEILNRLVPHGYQLKYLDHTCYINHDVALCFVDDSRFIVASSEARLKESLKQAALGSRVQKDLANFLTEAGEHDAAIWVKEPRGLPLALVFQDTKWASVTADITDQNIAVKMEFRCGDAKATSEVSAGLQAIMRMVLETMVAQLAESASDKKERMLIQSISPKLAEAIAYALIWHELEITGTTVNLSINLPLSGKILQSEVAKLIQQAESKEIETKPVGGMTLPSAHYLEHQPKYYPPDPSFPLQRELQYQQEVAELGSPVELLPMPRAASGVIQAGGTELPSTEAPVRVGRIIIEGGRDITEAEQAPSPAVKAPAAPPGAIKLTVVNVHKEPALLFTIDEAGKLTFKQKLPEGEAVDVQAIKGQRWIAIFSEKPAGESYSVSQTDAIWLLR